MNQKFRHKQKSFLTKSFYILGLLVLVGFGFMPDQTKANSGSTNTVLIIPLSCGDLYLMIDDDQITNQICESANAYPNFLEAELNQEQIDQLRNRFDDLYEASRLPGRIYRSLNFWLDGRERSIFDTDAGW